MRSQFATSKLRHIIPDRRPKAMPCDERFEAVSTRFRSCRSIAARHRGQSREQTFLDTPTNPQALAARVLANARGARSRRAQALAHRSSCRAKAARAPAASAGSSSLRACGLCASHRGVVRTSARRLRAPRALASPQTAAGATLAVGLTAPRPPITHQQASASSQQACSRPVRTGYPFASAAETQGRRPPPTSRFATCNATGRARAANVPRVPQRPPRGLSAWSRRHRSRRSCGPWPHPRRTSAPGTPKAA